LNSKDLENPCAIHTASVLYRKFSVFLLSLSFLSIFELAVAQESILDREILFEDQRSSVYDILNQISDVTGYFFIYDSKLVNSDKQVRLKPTPKPLKQILHEVIGDQSLDFKVIDKHILIFKQESSHSVSQPNKADSTAVFTVRGQIFDKQSKKSLPFVTVGILEKNIGTVSNTDGFFALRLPSAFSNTTIRISHLGYKTLQIPINLLVNQKTDIYLETEFISIQEVIIRNIDPKEIVKKAYQNRFENYSIEPVFITSFYREGVLRNSKYLNYSEAVLKIFKSSYKRSFESDQVKLLKTRKIVNVDQTDTLILKIKAGLKSCLSLDVAKSVPDFIDPQYTDSYNFTKVDMVSYNARNVYVIAFEQKEYISEPLYKGTMYIEMESFAIVKVDFEINPKYVKNADELFIVKKSKTFIAKPERIGYTVNYSLWDGKYYINHIRGDLVINYRKRYHLFFNRFHAFLELASCQIDTANVVRFTRDETLKTSTVFLDVPYIYDEAFWGNYNTITPEEKLNEALLRINTKIEETHP